MKIGKEYKVRFFEKARKRHCAINTPATSPYPGWDLIDIPVKCIGNYPTFWVVQVLEHTLPNAFLKHNKWTPYNITLDKFEHGKLYQIKGL